MEDVAVNQTYAELPTALRNFLSIEQANLWKPERFRATSVEAEFERQYLPESRGIFPVPCFKIERKHLHVYCYQDSRTAFWQCAGGSEMDGDILFPIHPAQLGAYGEFLATVRAENAADVGIRLIGTATSSARTLLVWPDDQPADACFAKLSLQARFIGDRRLARRRVASSVGLSHMVLQSMDAMPPGIRYFPETVGLIPRILPDSGLLFRLVPDDLKNGRVVLAPLFALIGGGSEYPPLLLRLVRNGKVDILEFLHDFLIAKFAGIWTNLVFDLGLILEAHGQDLLLAFSPDLLPFGDFYYRDFEGLTVDWPLRRARRLPEPMLPHSFDWFSAYETWGYPLYQLVSMKLKVSLFDYLHFVLAELESAILEWQADGVLGGGKVRKGELSRLFSHHLRRSIRDKFGLGEATEYDVSKELNRFVKFLMRVRKEILSVSV